MCVFRVKNHVTCVAGLPSGASSKVKLFAIFCPTYGFCKTIYTGDLCRHAAYVNRFTLAAALNQLPVEVFTQTVLK